MWSRDQTQAISNILAGEASNFHTEFSKRELTSEDDQLLTELAKALDEKIMDDEAFIDKFACESLQAISNILAGEASNFQTEFSS